MLGRKSEILEENEGKYISFIDWMKGIQVAGVIGLRKRPLHDETSYIRVFHCIDIDSFEFIDGVDEYPLGVEDEFVCKIKDMRFYDGEQNYRDLNFCWHKADEKRNVGKCTGDISRQ